MPKYITIVQLYSVNLRKSEPAKCHLDVRLELPVPVPYMHYTPSRS